ncbi:MAG: DUF4373 domain-containing protein [Lentilactobacillus diolivorans]|jgi:hypothetical protein|nr:DUF4373 domain-containing protein [Lentilactobacillus diolivorans]
MNSYFPHDSNARNSEKLLKVRMKYGAAGYGVYFMILERLRDEADYMSIKDYNVIAFDLRVDASMIKAVVEDFGLFVFTDDGKYFYSEGFKKRMAIKDQKSKKRAEAGKKGAHIRWQTDSNAIAKPLANDGKESKVNKSKVNKTKIKTNKPASQNKQLAEDFDKLWKLYPSKKGKKPAFSAYKRAIKSGVTNRQIQDGIIELVKHGDPKYYPNGSTWFNQERWSDTYDESPSEPRLSKKPVYSDGEQRSIDIMQAFSTHDHDAQQATQSLQAKYPDITLEAVERQVYPERFRKEDVF